MKFNLKDLKLKQIDGKEVEVKDANKTIANVIYYGIKDIELADKAMKLYQDKDIELNEKEIEILKELINKQDSGLSPFFVREINKILDAKQE